MVASFELVRQEERCDTAVDIVVAEVLRSVSKGIGGEQVTRVRRNAEEASTQTQQEESSENGEGRGDGCVGTFGFSWRLESLVCNLDFAGPILQ